MSYDEFLGELSDSIDDLAPRLGATVFWSAGEGLRSEPSLPATVADWCSAAASVAHEFIMSGEVAPDTSLLWQGVTGVSGADSSQLANSAVICVSTPLGIALEPGQPVGQWI